jgi:uncharacterized damage-inducible protein DinB
MARASIHDDLRHEWQELLASLPPERVNSPRWFSTAGPMRTLSAKELFAEVEEVRSMWDELRAAPLEQFAGRFINPAWTLKDLLAHLASWAGEFRREVEMAAGGQSFDYAIPYALSVVGPSQWNQVEVEKRAEESLDEIFQEFETETTRLQDLLIELPQSALASESAFPLAPSGDPAALWRGNSAQIVLMKCAHDRYHMGRIRHWLSSLTAAEQDG